MFVYEETSCQFDYETIVEHFGNRTSAIYRDNGVKVHPLNCAYECMMPNNERVAINLLSANGTINMFKKGSDVLFPIGIIVILRER